MLVKITILCLVLTFSSAALEQNYVPKTVDLATLSGHQDNTDTRIIGGTATTIERYPYTVQILYSNQLLCGGSILSKRHILTSAHCFFDQNGETFNAQYITIRAGTSSLASGGSQMRISTIVIHQSYNTPLRDNDVAILVLSSELKLSSSIGIASIPVQGSVVPDNSTVTHVGWGTTNTVTGTLAQTLQEVNVRVVNQLTCAQRYLALQLASGLPFPVTNNMICAGLLDEGGKDACQGDSGGPLIYSNTVVGITSWGQGCAEPLFPGVSARVSSYTNWINNVMAQYSSSSALSGVSSFLLTVAMSVALILNKSV